MRAPRGQAKSGRSEIAEPRRKKEKRNTIQEGKRKKNRGLPEKASKEKRKREMIRNDRVPIQCSAASVWGNK